MVQRSFVKSVLLSAAIFAVTLGIADALPLAASKGQIAEVGTANIESVVYYEHHRHYWHRHHWHRHHWHHWRHR